MSRVVMLSALLLLAACAPDAESDASLEADRDAAAAQEPESTLELEADQGRYVAPPALAQVAATVSDAELAQARFDALIDDLTSQWFTENPESATYWGVDPSVAGYDYNRRLNPRGPEGRQRVHLVVESMIARLEEVDPALLGEDQRLTRQVLLERLSAGLAVSDAAGYGDVAPDSYTIVYPITQLSGAHSDLPTMMQSQQPLEDWGDAEFYIQRLEAFGPAIDGVIETLRHDAQMGAVPPDFVIEGAIEVTDGFLESAPTENPLYTTFVERIADFDPAPTREELLQRAQEDPDAIIVSDVGQIPDLEDRPDVSGVVIIPEDYEPATIVGRSEDAARVVEEIVYPAYERLGEALREILPQATSDPAITSRPNGEEVYRALIRLLADSDLTPDEIHQIGLDEVDRIHAEMDAILDSVGMTEGTVGERMRMLGEDPQFLYPNTDEGRAQIIADLNVLLDEVMARAPEWFDTVPTQAMEVRRIPEFREDSAAGGYAAYPSVDGSRPGIYWVNLRDTATLPSYLAPTLTYHEGAPGHLLQGGIAVSQTDTPLLRTIFAGTNAFVEGWGLYAERLAWEMGLYDDDPYGDLGRLQYELHRAIRLVVDTGMHAKGWSRQEAIDYMLANEGSEPSEVEVEIERYAAWPAQALGYKLGMLKILELRERAQAALGDDFDIGAFHDAILSHGGLPLPVLEAHVDAWIAEQQPD